jgi:hypothetical protein
MVNILRRVAEWLIKISGDSSGAVQALDDVEKKSDETASEVEADAEEMAKKQEEYSQALGRTITVLSTATSAISSTFSAYMNLQNTQDAATQAQEDYNEAVAKFGSDSSQAQDALDKLEKAQNRVLVSNVMFIGNLIHTGSVLFTTGLQLAELTKKMKALEGAQTAMNFNWKMGATALGAIAFFMLAINSESETMRIVFSALAGVFVALTVAQMAYQAVLAGTLTMTGAGIAIVAAGIAAMALTYAASKAIQSDIMGSTNERMVALNEKMNDYEPGDIIINNYITAEKIDWEAAPVLLEQLSRTLQDNIERRCKTMGASL